MSKFVTVKVYSNRIEAGMAKSLLESHDIVATINAPDAGGMKPDLNAASGVEVKVSEEDLQKAKELLE